MITTGNRLGKLRDQRHLSREKLAELIGCHPTTINYWENDKRVPSPEFLLRLSKVYDVSIEYILVGKDFHRGKGFL